jgi:hypothetical protein
VILGIVFYYKYGKKYSKNTKLKEMKKNSTIAEEEEELIAQKMRNYINQDEGK